MESTYLDDLPNEIIFRILFYVPDRPALNKFIYSIRQLGIRFLDEEMWKLMFYQNFRDVSDSDLHIDEDYKRLTWREQYYYHINPVEDYYINRVNLDRYYTFIIIKGVNAGFLLRQIDDLKLKFSIEFIADSNKKLIYKATHTDPVSQMFATELTQKLVETDDVDISRSIGFWNNYRDHYSINKLVNNGHLTTFLNDLPVSYTSLYLAQQSVMIIERSH